MSALFPLEVLTFPYTIAYYLLQRNLYFLNHRVTIYSDLTCLLEGDEGKQDTFKGLVVYVFLCPHSAVEYEVVIFSFLFCLSMTCPQGPTWTLSLKN